MGILEAGRLDPLISLLASFALFYYYMLQVKGGKNTRYELSLSHRYTRSGW